jgi:DNA polymerase
MANTSQANFQAHYLQAMDIQLWIRRQLPSELESSAIPPSTIMSTDSQTSSDKVSPLNTPEEPLIASSITTNSHSDTEQASSVNTTPAIETPEISKPTLSLESVNSVDSTVNGLETNSSKNNIDYTINNRVDSTVNGIETDSPDRGLETDSVTHLKSEPKPEQLWEALQNRVAVCTACELHHNRTQTVFGVGNRQADLMLIGEGPGADEDAQGEPFVGRAGQLLNEMLYAINFKREDVYIANVVKCRPPGNRNPHVDEMVCCYGFLQQQIALVQPKLIVAVGRVAAQHLLQTQQTISKIRGQYFTYGENQIPLIPTFHPAYLLRSPSKKRESWQDLQIIWRTLNHLLEQVNHTDSHHLE